MNVAVATVVTVRFFASLRETVDLDAVELTLHEPTLASVRAQLATRLSTDQVAALNAEGVRVAVNQTIVQGDTDLTSGDEVAFLPPVTGG